MKGDVILNSVVRMVFFEAVIFEYSLEGGNVGNHAISEGRESQVLGLAQSSSEPDPFKQEQ